MDLKQILLREYPNQSVKEALENYKEIELTDEEMDILILEAKRNKRSFMEELARREEVEQARKAYTDTHWDYETTRQFMMWRAAQLHGNGVFQKPFVLDEYNSALFELLCCYFSGDEGFISLATEMGVANPSLTKGLMIVGNTGTGKTWLMKLFSKNKRQIYTVRNAKLIADAFERDGITATSDLNDLIKNPSNDTQSFCQAVCGLCIDDIGTDTVKIHFGNKKSVIGDIIENRYAKQNMGIYFHATSNLTASQVGELYGPRVQSRLREVVNFIELSGPDRRT